MKTEDEIKEAVVAGIKKVTSQDDLSIANDDRFEDLDLDSLDRMSIMVEVENRLEVDFDDADPAKLACINDYVEYVQSL